MKKTFPTIIILISLSLLGLIVLQTSWLKNLLVITEGQLYTKLTQSMEEVSVDLSKSVYSGRILKLPRRGGLTFNSDFHLHLLKPPSVEDKFTLNDVHNKLVAAFESKGLRDLKFEFAVSNTNDDYEMFSKGFQTVFWEDTGSNRRIYMPIIPDSGSDTEGLSSPEHIIVVVPDFVKQVWSSLKWVIIGAVAFMLVILAAFYVTVKSLINQKKLSEIKSDFINNMTHEFKTPLATISLAVDALRNDKVKNDPEKASYFSSIIKEENVRMNRHVETILQAALMERQELKLNLDKLSMHALIKSSLDNYQLQLKEKGATIELLLNAKSEFILADEVHFTNLLSNLVDNAIKYSSDKKLAITISTHSTSRHIVVRIADNGIGMSKESVKRIFEKFYRAHTGNLHNVKGFGLGMSYVKTVMDAHKGRIKVESAIGKGSSFTLEVPLAV